MAPSDYELNVRMRVLRNALSQAESYRLPDKQRLIALRSYETTEAEAKALYNVAEKYYGVIDVLMRGILPESNDATIRLRRLADESRYSLACNGCEFLKAEKLYRSINGRFSNWPDLYTKNEGGGWVAGRGIDVARPVFEYHLRQRFPRVWNDETAMITATWIIAVCLGVEVVSIVGWGNAVNAAICTVAMQLCITACLSIVAAVPGSSIFKLWPLIIVSVYGCCWLWCAWAMRERRSSFGIPLSVCIVSIPFHGWFLFQALVTVSTYVGFMPRDLYNFDVYYFGLRWGIVDTLIILPAVQMFLGGIYSRPK